MYVLIVDDSVLVRDAVSTLLRDEPDMSVAVAADPIIAMQKIRLQRPDVILLDIEMPRMDGLTFLRKLMSEDPIPVVICSAFAGARSEVAIQALHDGALAIVDKPKLTRDFLRESSVVLVDALRAAAGARLRTARGRGSAVAVPSVPLSFGRPREDVGGCVVAVGASTGGTDALRLMLSALPPNAPATLIVQHMPEGFTRHFARHLDAESGMEVLEAFDGERLFAGRALLAPGNRHMLLRRDAGGYFVTLDDAPLVSRHRPSVDVLFRSVAKTAGAMAVGVLLTGMGTDGAEGLAAMKCAGASTVAQDESSCVVFGMPKAAVALRAVDEVVPLDRIAATILRLAGNVR